MSGPFRWRGEVDVLVGEGEAVLEESLPPASAPVGTELSSGTGGALFRLRKFPSNAPLLLPSGRQSKAPSSDEWALRRGSPGLSGAWRLEDAARLSEALLLHCSVAEFFLSPSSLLLSPADCRASSSAPHCPLCSIRTLARFRLWKSR